ncbi:hypothetical protein DFO62_12619 [Serratia fonticola]|nr:hypothetical protein DFO62_12619 [Serratia fonticola]
MIFTLELLKRLYLRRVKTLKGNSIFLTWQKELGIANGISKEYLKK